jgi:CBS domain-containing protein
MSRDSTTPPGRLIDTALVGDVMSAPVVTCPPDVPLAEVAGLMTRHRIHAVVVASDPSGHVEGDREWGVISELDLVGGACLADPQLPAGRVAATPPVAVGRDEPLDRAAFLMAEHQVTHLIALDGGRAVGIVSALDVARALAPPAETPTASAPPPPRLTARAGDRLVIVPHQLGGQPRDAEVLEAHGDGGGPPFLVRWEDSGRISLLYPGSDARIEQTGRR